MPYQSSNIVVGPGTLYAAPLGTTEPTACTGAWPTGWNALGFTAQGSKFDYKITASPLQAEESLWTPKQVLSDEAADFTFELEEATFQSWQLALNAGIGTGQLTSNTGTNAGDGSSWVEPVQQGSEVRVMLGWDSLYQGTTSGPVQGRLIVRQCLQTGSPSISRRKGANPATLALTFSAELPATGLQPFRFINPASLYT